jgi:hypothetical protein
LNLGRPGKQRRKGVTAKLPNGLAALPGHQATAVVGSEFVPSGRLSAFRGLLAGFCSTEDHLPPAAGECRHRVCEIEFFNGRLEMLHRIQIIAGGDAVFMSFFPSERDVVVSPGCRPLLAA